MHLQNTCCRNSKTSKKWKQSDNPNFSFAFRILLGFYFTHHNFMHSPWKSCFHFKKVDTCFTGMTKYFRSLKTKWKIAWWWTWEICILFLVHLFSFHFSYQKNCWMEVNWRKHSIHVFNECQCSLSSSLMVTSRTLFCDWAMTNKGSRFLVHGCGPCVVKYSSVKGQSTFKTTSALSLLKQL